MRYRLISLLAPAILFCFAATLAPAQPLIHPGGVTNAASLLPPGLPGGGIAPGSIFLVRGRGLGPPEPVEAGTSPPGPELEGVSLRVIRGSAEWRALPLRVSSNEIRAVMPAAVSPGAADIVVSYQGRESSPSPARVAALGFGIFTLSEDGLGPVTDSAVHPGELVTISGTGLGARERPGDVAPAEVKGRAKVEVLVGGKPARVIRAGPKPVRRGMDEIEFEIPRDAPRGCHVPLQVRVAGSIPSNVVTLAIDPDPRACMEIARLHRYLRRGGRAGFVIPFRLSMRYDLNPSGKADFTGDALVAGFREAAGSAALGRLLYPPPVGCCMVLAEPVTDKDLPSEVHRALLPSADVLNAGVLRAGEPVDERSVAPPRADQEVYYGVLGGNMPDYAGETLPLFLKPGEVVISGLGGPDVGPFTVDVRVPEPIAWTNRNRTKTVVRRRDLTVKWKLREPGQLVAVVGVSVDKEAHVTAGFFCLANGEDRRFRIPATVLQSLPPSRPQPGQSHGFLFLATFPSCDEYLFAAGGLQALFGLGASFDGRTVRFR